MAKHIIEYKTKVDGEDKVTYHSHIAANESLSTNNVYVEHLTTKFKQSQIFYEYNEAKKVSELFANEFHVPTIITF